MGVKVRIEVVSLRRLAGSNPSSLRLSCRYNYQSVHALSIHFGNFSLGYHYFGKRRYLIGNSGTPAGAAKSMKFGKIPKLPQVKGLRSFGARVAWRGS